MQVHQDLGRKSLLVDLGVWALATERWWLVMVVTAAMQWEGLRHE
jgi:hypothetical protein